MTAEAVRADLSPQNAYTAVPPSRCLNGCQNGTGPAAAPVWCEPGKLVCPRCQTRLARWLREIPDCYALLPAVKDHGTVPGNPETARTKRPDAPAPMRLEITDLLDTRTGRGVLGIVHAWATLVRDERALGQVCHYCGHIKFVHDGHCTGVGCACQGYRLDATVMGECLLLSAHLPWITEQPWVEDLHVELKALARDLREAVGEYTIRPVGTCKARPAGQHDGVCGGPLFMDRTQTAVRCASCGQRQEADSGLRELGLKVGLISDTEDTTGSRRASA